MSANIDDAKGRIKEAAGDLTGNDDLAREGQVDQAKASVKEKVDKASDWIEDKVDDVTDWVREKVDDVRHKD